MPICFVTGCLDVLSLLTQGNAQRGCLSSTLPLPASSSEWNIREALGPKSKVDPNTSLSRTSPDLPLPAFEDFVDLQDDPAHDDAEADQVQASSPAVAEKQCIRRPPALSVAPISKPL